MDAQEISEGLRDRTGSWVRGHDRTPQEPAGGRS